MGYSQSAGLALATIFYLLIGVRSLLDCEVWPGDCAALEPLTYGAVSQMSGGDTRMAILTTEVFLPLRENGNEFFMRTQCVPVSPSFGLTGFTFDRFAVHRPCRGDPVAQSRIRRGWARWFFLQPKILCYPAAGNAEVT